MEVFLMDSIKQLRKLAHEYFSCAMDPINLERMDLHRAVNDLKMKRPIVLIDEIPWHELNFDGSLTLQCTDPVLRSAEDYLRKKLFQWKHFPADMILSPFLPVYKTIRTTGIGLQIQEKTQDSASKGGNIVSHEYIDQLATPEDLEKLHLPVLSYDKEDTMSRYTRLAEAIGDILPIRIMGHGCYCSPWDNIAMYRGVDNLLIDLIEEPEHTHNIVSKIYECETSRLYQMEELGLLEINPYDLHCTAAACSDLGKDYDGGNVQRKQIWGLGMAQIFASVSKAMHEEFDIDYMKKFMEPFGLNYYGCCEPLDRKMDIVEKLPNLRKVSITPWADVDIAAEAINTKYVLSSKPNPSSVSLQLNETALRSELGQILSAAKRNHCSCELVLKDISSAGSNLQNLVRWEQIAMEMVRSY